MPQKILIIDDDVEIATMMADVLKGEGYAVTLAHDGLRAIEKSNQEKLDLILLDIRMPFFSGFWFCDAFKKRPEPRHIPVIMVSALNEPEDIERAHQLGASAYLVKPFEPKELVELVGHALKGNSR
jgi:twitching motility two-component system response regulator PilH